MKKFLKPLICVVAFTTLSLGNVAYAKSNSDKVKLVEVSSISGQANLSSEESVKQFIKANPQYKEDALKILKEHNALNTDGSIKKDLGQAATTTTKTLNSMVVNEAASTNDLILGSGYLYTLAGKKQVDNSTLYGEIIWSATNNSKTAQSFAVSQTYTKSVTVTAGVSIGSTVGLSSALEATVGVNLSYSATWSLQQQYGASIALPGKTTGTIKVNPIYNVCTYKEQYYIFGNPVGNSKSVDVFVPIAPHWNYYQKSI